MMLERRYMDVETTSQLGFLITVIFFFFSKMSLIYWVKVRVKVKIPNVYCRAKTKAKEIEKDELLFNIKLLRGSLCTLLHITFSAILRRIIDLLKICCYSNISSVRYYSNVRLFLLSYTLRR